jgi:hypothetical protein
MLNPKDKFKRSSLRCFVCLIFILGIETALGIASTVSSYDGFCYGFFDGEWPCTFGEVAVNNIFWMSLSGCFLPPIPGIFWGIAIGRVLVSSKQLRPAISIILTFALAIVGGMLGFVVGIRFTDFLSGMVKVIGI